MRIIAGSARGRVFDAPKGRETRPTLDRVREAVFGMIQFDVENALVLDLFAGSGALGLEALSRGARHVVFCDSSREACTVIESNLNKLGFSDRASVFCMDCFLLLDRFAFEKKKFSIVLLDPPYESGLYERVIEKLISAELIEDGGTVLAEHPKRMELKLPEANIKKARKPHSYGDVAITKFTYEPSL